MFKQILVPTDGSQLSQDAARSAVSFAKNMGAGITAFYAKKEYPVRLFVEDALIKTITPEEFDRETEKEAQNILGFVEKLCHEAGVEYKKSTQTSNSIYSAIIETAAKMNCDLIFMASHGRRGVDSLLLGSETSKVLTHSKIPVLVYR